MAATLAWLVLVASRLAGGRLEVVPVGLTNPSVGLAGAMTVRGAMRPCSPCGSAVVTRTARAATAWPGCRGGAAVCRLGRERWAVAPSELAEDLVRSMPPSLWPCRGPPAPHRGASDSHNRWTTTRGSAHPRPVSDFIQKG